MCNTCLKTKWFHNHIVVNIVLQVAGSSHRVMGSQTWWTECPSALTENQECCFPCSVRCWRPSLVKINTRLSCFSWLSHLDLLTSTAWDTWHHIILPPKHDKLPGHRQESRSTFVFHIHAQISPHTTSEVTEIRPCKQSYLLSSEQQWTVCLPNYIYEVSLFSFPFLSLSISFLPFSAHRNSSSLDTKPGFSQRDAFQ